MAGVIFDDDEEFPTESDNSESDDGFTEELLTMTLINNQEAPLQQTDFNVMVSLKGATSNDRKPLDLVVILDISGSMRNEKLKRMKTATEYIIGKLGGRDRVSVVTFKDDANRLCPLRLVTEESRQDILKLVDKIYAGGSTNIADGLQTGLKVLKDRKFTDNDRVDTIMLMSDGEENHGTHAADVEVKHLPVYTFGFGTDHDPKVLNAITHNSLGATFSDVQDVDKLSDAFATCLIGLLAVVVKDLKLTVTSIKKKDLTINSTIKKVDAGSYKQVVDVVGDGKVDIDGDENCDGGFVSITFGNLYQEEVRNVVVTLDLPAIAKDETVKVLEVSYTESSDPSKQNRISASITRTANYSKPEEEEALETEMVRNNFTKMIKQARVLAEGKQMEDAQKKLIEARKVLEDSKPSSSIETMKHELDHLSGLMTSREVYKKQGRSYLLSLESSHDRQRFALRGDVEKHRMFAIPHVDRHFEEVKSSVK